MGKNQHSKDRLYVTAWEQRNEWGNPNDRNNKTYTQKLEIYINIVKKLENYHLIVVHYHLDHLKILFVHQMEVFMNMKI